MKLLVTIIQCKKSSFTSRTLGEEGRVIDGYNCSGFTDKGTAITFWSERAYPEQHVIAFDADLATPVELTAKIWDGKVKYKAVS